MSGKNEKTEKNNRLDQEVVTIKRILTFFIPLGLTSMMMMMSHSIIAAGIARTYLPEISMAAYAVSLNVIGIMEAPMVLARQMSIALFKGPRSFAVVRNVAGLTVGFLSLISLAVAFTPFGSFVFSQLLGVPDNLMLPTLQVFRFVMLMPIVSCIRSLYHGVLITRQRTFFVTQAMFARIALMVTLIFVFTQFDLVRGGYVGGVTIVAGIGMEAFYAMFRGRRLVEPPDGVEDPGDKDLTFSRAATFFYPLLLAGIMFSFTRPIMTAGMSRSLDPAIALAAYSVATAVGWIFIAPCQNVHQATMVFVREKEGFAQVRRFAKGFGLTGSLLLAAIAFTPLGHFVLTYLIGVSDQMLLPVLRALRVLCVMPLIMSLQEYFMGILLVNQHTRIVSLCKAGNLLAVTLMVLIGVFYFPHWGSVIGAAGQLAGFSAELLVAGGAFVWMKNRGLLEVTEEKIQKE